MNSALKTWLRSFLDVRPGEGSQTALAFSYERWMQFAEYSLKLVGSPLFLYKFDGEELPGLGISLAVPTGGGAS